jgi:hypothetical protein
MDLETYTIEELQLKRKSIRRQLLKKPNLQGIRIAVLGGSTTNEVVDLLEVLLLDSGFEPVFYQSEYQRYYEDAVLEPHTIAAFRPDLAYIHTTAVNIQSYPRLSSSEAELSSRVATEIDRYRSIWQSLQQHVGCQIIQNNFELPFSAILGNLDAVSLGGHTRFINELNLELARSIEKIPGVILQDIQSIAARLGLNRWVDPDRWFSYKLATTIEGRVVLPLPVLLLPSFVPFTARAASASFLISTTRYGAVLSVTMASTRFRSVARPRSPKPTRPSRNTAYPYASEASSLPSAPKMMKKLPNRDSTILTPS